MDDPERFERYSLQFEDILVDYSKNLISNKTLELLIRYAEKRNLAQEIENMFSGQKINKTENRSVLHVALRNTSNTLKFPGQDALSQRRDPADDLVARHDRQFRIGEFAVDGEPGKGYDIPGSIFFTNEIL